MIWHAGTIRDAAGLAIPATDRAFEHGLGLFETFRAIGGRPRWLDRHRDRMLGSAQALGLDVRAEDWPTAGDVERLVAAEGAGGDRAIRVTATGGSGSTPSMIWMASRPLPPLIAAATVGFGAWEVLDADPMARHKSLNYWSRRIAFERAGRLGLDEMLGTCGGTLREGSRTNLFGVSAGRIVTPAVAGPIVPGIARRATLEAAAGLGAAVAEVEGFDPAALDRFDELFLTNSARGVVPIGRVVGPDGEPAFDRPAPGSWARRLGRSLLEDDR